MNFFKLYVGDYQRDTGHLSVTEHGAYMLMLQHHYATERPLPTGKALHRLLRAQDKKERDAIDAVVGMFWLETQEGLVNERAIKEFGRAAEVSETNRAIALAREEKKRARREHEACSKRATDTARPGHEQSTNQTPDTRQENHSVARDTGIPSTSGRAGPLCARVRRESGLVQVNPGDPRLQAAFDAGVTDDEIVSACADAAQAGKGWAYALSTAMGRHRDAQTLGENHAITTGRPRSLSAPERVAAAIAERDRNAGGRTIEHPAA